MYVGGGDCFVVVGDVVLFVFWCLCWLCVVVFGGIVVDCG